MIQKELKKLICYGLEKNLFTERDEIFVTIMLIDALGLDEFDCNEKFSNVDLESTLAAILDYAVEKVKDIVIITLADEGAYYKTKESFGYINGKKQKAVDTTGAGDIFFGTFLNEYLKEEYNISAAIKKANIAGGLSVLKKGAIPSIPNIYELEKIDD